MAGINGHRNTLLLLRARLLGDMGQMANAALSNIDVMRMPSDMVRAIKISDGRLVDIIDGMVAV